MNNQTHLEFIKDEPEHEDDFSMSLEAELKEIDSTDYKAF
jgi:hypothetical protein